MCALSFFRKTDENEIRRRVRAALADAQSVVIGAGAGLSTSAGFVYAGERFARYFSDFGERYGFRDMYSGGFSPFSSPKEQWAYWSRNIYVNRYMDPPKKVYERLRGLIGKKDAFVITTNVGTTVMIQGFSGKIPLKPLFIWLSANRHFWDCPAA